MPELWGKDYRHSDLMRRAGSIQQVGGVRLVTMGDGAERGVRVLEFRTGTGFEFDVIVDRAMDIGRCEQSGRALGWLSDVGYAGPWYYEPEGLGWLRGFYGGLLTTCGLEHALQPAEDTAAQYRYPGKPTEAYGLHGRISDRPARLTGYGERWEGDQCVLWAQGEVLQAAVFGEHLLLRRRIEARLGESRLSIQDEVENVGFDRTPHMFLYHVNIGFPVVDDGSEILAPERNVSALGDYAVDGYTCLDAPMPDHVERVYEHELAAEPDGIVPVGIVNRALGLGVYQLYNQGQLPHHFVWRMLGEGTYVVGIEPCTNRPAGRLDARSRGELIELAAGERRSYSLELGALTDSAAIEAFEQRVRALVR